MSDDVMRAIGRLEGKMETVCRTVSALDTKLDNMQAHGCAMGGENRRRIEALETYPRRAAQHATVGAGAVTGIVWAVLEGVRHFLNK